MYTKKIYDCFLPKYPISHQMGLIGFVLTNLLFSLNIFAQAPLKNCAEFVQILSPTAELPPNETTSVDFVIKNCGNFDWLKSKVFLSHHWYKDGKMVKWDDIRVPISKLTLPNQIITISSAIRAPYKAGEYTVRFDLVLITNGGEEWFSESNNPTGNIKITVKEPILIGTLNTDFLFAPELKNIYPHTLRPQVKVLLQGSNFSTKKGKVFLTLPSGKSINMKILDWWDKVIVAQVPDITGEISGPATIYIEKHTTTKSNILSKLFIPDEEILVMSDNWILDRCGDPHACVYNCNFGGSTIGAYHYNQVSWWPFSSGCWDVDTYTIFNKHKNGWTYEGYRFWYLGKDNVSDIVFYENCVGNGCPRAHLSFSGDQNSPELKARVDWNTGGVWQYIYYHLNIYIKGPKGVTY